MEYLIMFALVFGVTAAMTAVVFAIFRARLVTKMVAVMSAMITVCVMCAFVLSKIGFGSLWSLGIVFTGTVAVLLYIFYVIRDLSKPLEMVAEGAERFAVGDVSMEGMDTDKMARIIGRRDELGQIGRAFNDLIHYIQIKAQTATSIAAGEMNVELELASEDDLLGNSYKQMHETLDSLIRNMDEMYQAQLQGKLSHSIDAEQYEGVYQKVASQYNAAVKHHIDSTNLMLELLGEYSEGDLSKTCPDFPGDQIIATQRFNKLRENLLKVIEELEGLVSNSIAGDLSHRADASMFSGRFKSIIEGLNELLSATVHPVEEAKQVFDRLAHGDLSRFMEDEYSGEYATFKESINQTVHSLNSLIRQVNEAILQVNSGASQVANTSQSLAQGATEQAGSLQEISSSVTEVSSQSRMNAEHASQGSKLTTETLSSANEGEARMKDLLQAMSAIDGQTSEISRVVKVIDEIAFQTNLLALNASVEAARAGVHGKGFAVVAEEVRNLAIRSGKAASETTELIEGSVRQIHEGMSATERTANAISEIGTGIAQVNEIMKQIAQDSDEQSTSVEQISLALQQIDEVTQSTTANAEEGAAASEELSSQARNLSAMVEAFKLADSEEVTDEIPFASLTGKVDEDGQSRRRQAAKSSGPRGEVVDPDIIIDLDDDDLADF